MKKAHSLLQLVKIKHKVLSFENISLTL